MQFIDLQAQQERIRPQIDRAIKGVLDHGKYIMGPEVGELESQLAEFVGVRHAIGCSSGTDALLLGLLAYEVGPGDAIFTTPFTFFATCEMIALTGATPVFVDIDPDTYNIDPEQLELAIEKAQQDGKLTPRGIIPVDLFGLPADYDSIMSIADTHGFFVLEDAAQAFGASYKGRRAPGLGHIGVTSFFPAKPLGCYGDGGAVFTDDDQLAETIRSLLVHGKGSDKYNNVRIGLNARLDTMQAAILIEKLKIYEEEISLRQKVAVSYTEAIYKLSDPLSPKVPEGLQSVWAQYTVRSKQREEIQKKLNLFDIPSAVYYVKPVHLLDAMANLKYSQGDFPEAERASAEVLSLPFYPYISDEAIGHVIEVLSGNNYANM